MKYIFTAVALFPFFVLASTSKATSDPLVTTEIIYGDDRTTYIETTSTDAAKTDVTYNKNPDEALSVDDSITYFTFKNKGGYVAKVELEYQYTKTWQDDYGFGYHHSKVKVASKWIPVNATFEFKFPGNIHHTKVTAYLKTGLVWSPIRTITTKNFCSYNNQWTDNDSSTLNKIELHVWSTTLAPKWRFMQPNNTHYNGVDLLSPCWTVAS